VRKLQGKITDQTISRMEDTLNRPIRRGLDAAINECMDKITNNSENPKTGDVDCMCLETKRILEESKV